MPFDPESISGLRVWLDAAQITGLADTDPVSSWPNLIAAESESFTQATSGNRPTFQTGEHNGLPGVSFDGSDDQLNGSVARTQKPVTVFVVARRDDANNNGLLGDAATATHNALASRVVGASGKLHVFTWTGTAFGLNVQSASSQPVGETHLWDYSYGAAGAWLIGYDGTDDASGTNNVTVASERIALGTSTTSSDQLKGFIHEVLIYDTVLSTADRQDVRDYLVDKWLTAPPHGGGETGVQVQVGATGAGGVIGTIAGGGETGVELNVAATGGGGMLGGGGETGVETRVTATGGGYGNPSTYPRFLGLLANVGVGFQPTDATVWGTGGTPHPDGVTTDFPRFLSLLANNGVGFRFTDRPQTGGTEAQSWGTGIGGTWGDGDEREFPRFLAAFANLDATQPCPTIFTVTPPVGAAGDTLVVTGQGLVSASTGTADAWAAEVRLYDTPSFAAPYVVMAQVSRTAGDLDTISVTVPGGATSGWVAVVHTATPTCDGSNFLHITVTAVVGDPDAGWWVEVWDLANTAPIIRPLPMIVDAGFEIIGNDVGSGFLTLPRGADIIGDIVNMAATPPVQRLVKFYLWGRYAYGLIPELRDEAYTDDDAEPVRIVGDGPESMLRWGKVLWRDYPAQPAQAKTWLFGSTTNVTPWGRFDPPNLISNGGFEDANEVPFTTVAGAQIIADTARVFDGAYALKITPAAVGDGAACTVNVTAGQRVYVTAKLSDAVDSGDDVTVHLRRADTGVSLASQVVEVRTTWATAMLETVVPAGVTSLTVEATWTDPTGAPHAWWMDEIKVVDDPGPWELDETTVTLSDDYIIGGSLYGAELGFGPNGNAHFVGVIATFDTDPNRDYTQVVQLTGPAGTVVKVGLRLGGLDEATVTLSGPGTWDTVTLGGAAGPEQTTGRMAVASLNAAAVTVHVGSVVTTPGAAAATAGAIVGNVLAAMQARGTLTFVTPTFTGLIDSAGNVWPEPLAMQLDPQWSLWDLLTKFVGLGYEVEFAPVAWRAGGDTGWELGLYAPAKAGVDYTGAAAAPTVLPGPGLIDAAVHNAPAKATVIFAEGAEGLWATEPADPAVVAALGRREDFVAATGVVDVATAAVVARRRLTERLGSTSQWSATLGAGSSMLPFLAAHINDTVRAHLPDATGGNMVADDWYRIKAIAARLSDEITFDVDFGSYRLDVRRGQALLLARLMAKAGSENYTPGSGSVS